MSTIVSLGRILDGAIIAAFALIVAGMSLYALGLAHYNITVTQKGKLGAFSNMISRALPFKNDLFEFNLTHVILYAILIAIMSLTHHRRVEKKAREEEKKEKEAKKNN
jgi:uncharacterized membrane protein YidH (DUF202 family)